MVLPGLESKFDVNWRGQRTVQHPEGSKLRNGLRRRASSQQPAGRRHIARRPAGCWLTHVDQP
jgi:hypothetical protein